MKKMRFLLVLLVGISIVSCTNDLDEMLGTQNLQTRSVEPRFTGNISESQAIALMNKFLDAPSFFYFEDVIGFDPTTSISTGSFTVNRNGKTIHVRSIQVGVIGKNGKYGVYGTPVTSKEFYSLRNGMVLHGEPIYEENDVERANPVGMRYYYTTNDVNHSQNCWIAIPSSIVLMGSIAGRLAVAESPVYAASKAGVRSLARSLAADFVTKGIRVNVVSPGPTDTPAYRKLKGEGNTLQQVEWEKKLSTIPMNRLGTPEEVAKAVLFLASSDSSFTTGAEILVDGGEVYLS